MTTATHADLLFMERAVALAKQARGNTSPNPPVGCVLVREDQVISEGWHRRAGQDHAEVDALKHLNGKAPGATAYVTLEPCNFTGRTGPCTEALITAGIQRVVVGTLDPNPKVSGSGVKQLRDAGITVDTGVAEHECGQLIAAFACWVTTGKPLVTLKIATTLDGRIATRTNHSQWITGEESRALVHRMRDEMDAIVVGSGTIRADNPQLTARIADGNGRNPIRIILSSDLDLPSDATVLSPDPRTIIATESECHRSAALIARGIELWEVGQGPHGVALDALLDRLGAEGVTSLLVEGGQKVATAFLAEKRVNRLCCFVAPRIVGADGIHWAGAFGISTMDQAIQLTDINVRTLGDDVCIEGNCVYRNC